jgi:hypothetical protein
VTKKCAFLVVSLCVVAVLFSSCAILAGTTFESVVSSEPEEESGGSGSSSGVPAEEEHQLTVITDPNNAAVWIDGTRVGHTPVTIDGLDPGTHRLRIEKEGFYSEQRWINLPGSGSVTIDITLEEVTGFLDVQTDPRSATVRVDGVEVPGGFIETGVGFHRVTVQQFGYVEQSIRTYVLEQAVTRVDVTLERAPFEVSRISLARDRFNPANPGSTGTAVLTFRVSAPGRAVVRVVAQDGRLVTDSGLGPFDTWDQEYRWDGQDRNGKTVPDGVYTIELVLSGDDGRDFDRTASVEVDSSLLVRYRSVWSSGPGLLYAPTLAVLPPGFFQVGVQVGGTFGLVDGELVSRFPGQLGLRVGVGANIELAFSGGLIAHSQPIADRWSAGGSLTWRAPSVSLGPGMLLATGVEIGGIYRSPSSDGLYAAPDTFANAGGMHASIPVEISFGRVSAVIAPQINLSPAPVHYGGQPLPPNEWGFHSYLKTGVYADLSSLTVGVSAALRSSRLNEGYTIELPFQAGAELHWIVPRTSLALSAFAVAEIERVTDFYLFGGIGVGFLF